MKAKSTFVLLIICICGCRDKLKWNLSRDGYYDARKNDKRSVYKLYTCENYVDFSFIMGSASDFWQIASNGYKGNCFYLSSTRLNSNVLLNYYCNKENSINIWIKSVNQGYQGIIPTVKINGKGINTVLVDGDRNGWFKLQTASIDSGNINLSVEFGSQLTNWSYYIDEIAILCNNN